MEKKKKNTIFCLQHENGIMSTDEQILEHASQYYKNLFGPSDKSFFYMKEGCWNEEEKVNKEENEKLIKDFSRKEVREVIFSMEKNTAPGPDHLPIEFYQSCWDIV